MLAFAFQFLLQASNAVAEERGFPWTIHAITIPATLLVGVVIGWFLRERKAAEDKAREEISKG
ncbi:MAG: hypothetical protein IT462_05735 [Planctomycetes bacterium]|nr:hypothetical protein [Planctomycetota bacterium]